MIDSSGLGGAAMGPLFLSEIGNSTGVLLVIALLPARNSRDQLCKSSKTWASTVNTGSLSRVSCLQAAVGRASRSIYSG